MKKLAVGLGFLMIALAGGFVWLLMQADAHNAPQGEVVVDLTDQIQD